MKLTTLTDSDIPVIQKWLTPEVLDLVEADDLFDERKPKVFLMIRLDDHTPVGFFSVYNIDMKNKKCEIGVTIGEKAGHQVAPVAFKQILKDLFARGINRIYIRPLSRNEKTVRGAQLMGFEVEGHEREAVFKNGKFEDLTILSILKSDYERKWS